MTKINLTLLSSEFVEGTIFYDGSVNDVPHTIAHTKRPRKQEGLIKGR